VKPEMRGRVAAELPAAARASRVQADQGGSPLEHEADSIDLQQIPSASCAGRAGREDVRALPLLSPPNGGPLIRKLHRKYAYPPRRPRIESCASRYTCCTDLTTAPKAGEEVRRTPSRNGDPGLLSRCGREISRRPSRIACQAHQRNRDLNAPARSSCSHSLSAAGHHTALARVARANRRLGLPARRRWNDNVSFPCGPPPIGRTRRIAPASSSAENAPDR